jgi:hypothetical protein
VLLGSGDVLASIQQCRELAAVVLVGNQRVGVEHGFEALAGAARAVPDFDELFEVAGDLTLVPGDYDRFDVWEVLVQRRSPDAGRLRDATSTSCKTVGTHVQMPRARYRVASAQAGLPENVVAALRA